MNFAQDLENIMSNNTVVSIFSDENNMDKFCCGNVIGIDNEFVYINHITPYGDEDGIVIRKLDNINKIEYDGVYEKRIVKLYTIKNSSHINYINNTDEGMFLSLLNNIQKNNYVSTISIGNSDEFTEITGMIQDYDNNKINIYKVNENGIKDGIAIILIKDINLIDCDTEFEKSISLLYKNNIVEV